MRLRNSYFSLLFLLAPVASYASNPTIVVNRDPPNPTIIFNNNFSFGANSTGGGDFSFQNGTTNNWLELTVNATLPTLTPITCGPGPFSLCTISETAQPSGFLYQIVFGPAPNGGIPAGGLFSIDLNDSGTDPTGSGSWPANQDFGGKANDVSPEPAAGMLALLGAGLMTGVGIYRRRRAAV